MELDADHLREHLAAQGITVTDEDLRHVRRVMSIIAEGEERLTAFPDLAEEKIMLTLDGRELTVD